MHLVDRLKEKEEDALLELMQLYGDYLMRTAFLILKDKQAAEEAVQDTFITAYRKIDQLQTPDKLKSWLTMIVINHCRGRMRKGTWRHIFFPFETDERTKVDETVQSPEEELIASLENKELSIAIQKLDYKYREAITLFYFNELKISEISSVLKTGESTVKSRLKRGRSLLKEILFEGDEQIEE